MKAVLNIERLSALDGGPPRAVLAVARELSASGIDVHIVCRKDRSSEIAAGRPEAERAGVTTHAVHPLGLLGIVKQIFVAVRTARGSDIVSCHGFYHVTVLTSLLASIVSGSKFVIQPHGVFEPYQEMTSRYKKALFNLIVGKAALRRATAIFVATEMEQHGIVQSRPELAGKVRVVGMGVPRDLLTKRERNWRTRDVLFLSRIAPKKRLDLLIESVAICREDLPDIRLHVCGTGDERYVSELTKIAGPGPHIEWLGHVSGLVRRTAEDRATLFCLPSENENFGQAVTEALAAGLPVITTLAVGASEHVERARAGWVLTDPTPQTLADAIKKAYADPELLQTMSQNAQDYVREHLSWQTVATNWVKLIEDERTD